MGVFCFYFVFFFSFFFFEREGDTYTYLYLNGMSRLWENDCRAESRLDTGGILIPAAEYRHCF